MVHNIQQVVQTWTLRSLKRILIMFLKQETIFFTLELPWSLLKSQDFSISANSVDSSAAVERPKTPLLIEKVSLWLWKLLSSIKFSQLFWSLLSSLLVVEISINSPIFLQTSLSIVCSFYGGLWTSTSGLPARKPSCPHEHH